MERQTYFYFSNSFIFILKDFFLYLSMLARIKDLESQIEQREQELKSKHNKLESLHPKLNQIIDVNLDINLII
jgi:hypothetical protein